MISQISLSSKTLEAFYEAKEIEEREFKDAIKWMTDIEENPDREKKNYCEICGHSDSKLEIHHVRRRKYGNECITACIDCHQLLTDKQRLWNHNNSDNLFDRGMIDICHLKYAKTDVELYRRTAENLTRTFKVAQ